MRNKDIRLEMAASDLKQWEVAEVLGISESHFSRQLRHELADEEKSKIRAAIAEILKEGV